MIVLLETIHPDAHEMLAAVDDVVLVAEPPSMDMALVGPDVRAIVTRGLGRITAELIDSMTGLEAVARCGAGLDNVDTTAAEAAGVAVLHAPGVTADAVAEQAVMLMLALARRLGELDRGVKAGNWAIRNGYEGIELRGKRLGIVGVGSIGSRVGELGRALRMDVVCTTRSDRDTPFPRVSLDELLVTSDVVQLCVPQTADTTALIGEDQLAAMKPGALLVNTARGPIVDHDAVAAAIRSRSLGGYGADVWDPEPPAHADDLIAQPNVIVTPHIAAITDVTYREICVMTAGAVVDVLAGRNPDPRAVFVSRRRS